MATYCQITDGSTEIPANLLAGMLRLRHHLNPDFERFYPQVSYWYLEADGGRIAREIGFIELIGGRGVPVVLAPYGRNAGLWTTLELLCGERDGIVIEKSEFDREWNRLIEQLSAAPR